MVPETREVFAGDDPEHPHTLEELFEAIGARLDAFEEETQMSYVRPIRARAGWRRPSWGPLYPL
jgi:heterodisulfide reductase subunit B